MREIIFRGKRTDPGNEWVYGGYCSKKETTYAFSEDYVGSPVKTLHYIVVDTMTDYGLPNMLIEYDVMPETVGQYTGLLDKNGKEIFEGDIVCNDDCYGIIKYGRYGFYNIGFYIKWINPYVLKRVEISYWAKKVCVIGNIYDNPELIN